MDELTEKELVLKVGEYLQSLGFIDLRYEEDVLIGKHLTGKADITVYYENKPFIIAEINRRIPLSFGNFHPLVDQALTYANALDAKFLLVTDGNEMHWFEIKLENERKQVYNIALPPLLNKKESSPLTFATEQVENLEYIISNLRDILRGRGFSLYQTSNLLLEFLLLKLKDEETGRKMFVVGEGESPERTREKLIILKDSFISDQIVLSHLNTIDNSLLQSLIVHLQDLNLTEYKNRNTSSYYEILINEFTNEAFYKEGEFATQLEISKAISNLFDLKDGDKVLDPALGIGGLLMAAYAKNASTMKQKDPHYPKFIGVELIKGIADKALINLTLLGVPNLKIITGDFFDKNVVAQLSEEYHAFDYIFVDVPMGKTAFSEQISSEAKGLESLKTQSKITLEALYLAQVCEMLKPGKFAALLVPEGLLVNPRYRDLRKYILSKAYLRCVISFPSGIYKYTYVKTSLIILQKMGESTEDASTLMISIDESALSTKKVLQENLDIAVNAYRSFSITGKLDKRNQTDIQVTLAKVTESNGYRFDFAAFTPRYIRILERLESGPYKVVKLGDIAKIKLGLHTKDESEGDLPVIKASSIPQNDVIQLSNSISYISTERVADRNLIKPKDLLITRNSQNFRVALVEENFPVAVAHSSIVVITVNKDIVRPEYLLAILQHEVVKAQLDYLSPSISVLQAAPSTLSNIRIPILSLDQQDLVVASFNEAIFYRKMALAKQKEAETIINMALGSEDENEA